MAEEEAEMVLFPPEAEEEVGLNSFRYVCLEQIIISFFFFDIFFHNNRLEEDYLLRESLTWQSVAAVGELMVELKVQVVEWKDQN